MTRSREVALQGRILAGGFSGERVFEVPLAAGGQYRGLAPRHYCWTESQTPLSREEPEPGAPISGLVAALRLRDLPNGNIVVTTPDGEIFVVSLDTVTERPTAEIAAHVPV